MLKLLLEDIIEYFRRYYGILLKFQKQSVTNIFITWSNSWFHDIGTRIGTITKSSLISGTRVGTITKSSSISGTKIGTITKLSLVSGNRIGKITKSSFVSGTRIGTILNSWFQELGLEQF